MICGIAVLSQSFMIVWWINCSVNIWLLLDFFVNFNKFRHNSVRHKQKNSTHLLNQRNIFIKSSRSWPSFTHSRDSKTLFNLKLKSSLFIPDTRQTKLNKIDKTNCESQFLDACTNKPHELSPFQLIYPPVGSSVQTRLSKSFPGRNFSDLLNSPFLSTPENREGFNSTQIAANRVPKLPSTVFHFRWWPLPFSWGRPTGRGHVRHTFHCSPFGGEAWISNFSEAYWVIPQSKESNINLSLSRRWRRWRTADVSCQPDLERVKWPNVSLHQSIFFLWSKFRHFTLLQGKTLRPSPLVLEPRIHFVKGATAGGTSTDWDWDWWHLWRTGVCPFFFFFTSASYYLLHCRSRWWGTVNHSTKGLRRLWPV